MTGSKRFLSSLEEVCESTVTGLQTLCSELWVEERE